ncbi:hypothetical protein CBL_13537 [Carabus blaptoides fortunei]
MFFSIFSSIVIIASYFCGCVVSFCLIKYRIKVGFCLQRLTNLYHGHITPKKTHNKACTICENLHCNRHKNATLKEPWKGILINKDLNQAVEAFFNKILENFVSSWYVHFTDDTAFINELRSSVRFTSATIINRYLEIDIGQVISHKILPCALRHTHDCLQIQEKAEKDNISLEKAAVSHLGKRLHAAVTNRDNELEYLRQLTAFMLPYMISKSQLKCNNFNLLIREIIAGWVFLPLMDVIADPNIINLLVNLLAKQKSKLSRNLHKSNTRVELLYNFTNYAQVKEAALGYDLTKIFKSPEILYSFMQYLKDEGPVNVLQFCLDVEEFNRKLLTPDLSKKDLDALHLEANQLHQLYLKEYSSDYIGCPSDIASSFETLLQGGAQNIPILRTSPPLYKAYDYAFGILETRWLPLFYHSDEFYKLACGSKITASYHKSSGARGKKGTDPSSQGTVSKISSGLYKIKGALRTQPIEGAVYPQETQTYETDPSIFIEQNIYRDLSAWRVSISYAEQIGGPKSISIFHINIKRIDTCSESERYWTVQRHDQDFYTLKIKLVEFHGVNEICDSPLPSRRSTTPIETRKQKYEEFLQKLLQKPSLRGSDLLYTFLTTKQNFTMIADTSVPIVSDLENIYQSVAHKLRKEKGQHLDSFMSTFLASTETGKSKINKYECPDMGEEADTGISMDGNIQVKNRNIKKSIFVDNFGIPLPETTVYTPMTINPRDIIQCSSYLLSRIFHAPSGVLRMFNSICNVAHRAVESFARVYIEREIKHVLSEHTLAHLINLLQDVLFVQKHIPLTKVELEERKLTAFNNIAKLNRGFVCYWLGLDVNEGLTTLLRILQHPQLNKQLAYSLLDIIVVELYPECKSAENFKTC